MARETLSIPISMVASKASFFVGGRVVYDKRCGLSIMTIEAFVCLKGWNLANAKGHEAIREVELVEAFQQLKLERPE